MQILGNLEEAECCYSKALSLKPGLYIALINRCQLFFDKGEFALALKDADSCNTIDSRACALETLYSLGRVDLARRIESAIKIFISQGHRTKDISTSEEFMKTQEVAPALIRILKDENE